MSVGSARHDERCQSNAAIQTSILVYHIVLKPVELFLFLAMIDI